MTKNRRKKLILALSLLVSLASVAPSPAASGLPALTGNKNLIVPAYAYQLLTYSRQYHKAVSDLETFFRVVIPRVAAKLDGESETWKTSGAMRASLQQSELFPLFSLSADYEIYFIETRGGTAFLRRPEELESRPGGLFLVDVTFACPFNEDVRTELARQRLGEPTDNGIKIRFLPSVVDVPSLLMQIM